MSGHKQRREGLHGKTAVKEGKAAPTEHRQGPRCFFPRGGKKINHFSKRFLSKQEDNIRSFPQPNMGSLLHLENVDLCPGWPQWGLLALSSTSLPSRQFPGFCHCCLHYCSPFSPNLCLKSALLQDKATTSSRV